MRGFHHTPFVLLFLFAQFFFAQESNSLFDQIDNSESKQEFLPSSMIFTQRLLWGEKGMMRKTGIVPLNLENREQELKIRRKMLSAHQYIGYLTLAGMVAQGVFGVKLYNGQYQYEDLHETIGNLTTASYFTGAALSLFTPPPLISTKNKGLTSIKAHKWLASLHFSAMIATNLLSESNKSAHRAAAYTLFGSYALAVISFKL